MRVSKWVLAAAVCSIGLPVMAGPYADAEVRLRASYASYRAALFLSNQGKAADTEAALQDFAAGWNALGEAWMAEAPPQYADDAQLGQTFATVKDLLAEANAHVQDGKLPEAHEVLEAVRDQIGDLHRRNGVIGFSDRMNAYHAAMEDVLLHEYNYAALGDAGALQAAGDALVLDYLAQDIANHPAPEAQQMDYEPLMQAFLASVAAFKEAAMSGDLAAAEAAQAQLKAPYSKLFAKFG